METKREGNEMKISLKYDGEPYIVLLSEKPAIHHTEQCTDAELLEQFIRQAKKRGLELKNESDMDSRNDYASIRLLKEPEAK